MPYAMLISVIVGITNIIPVFGPFFGAIPSAFILLLTDPGKCLIFIVFVIVLHRNGWQYHWSQDSGGFHRAFRVLGPVCPAAV